MKLKFAFYPSKPAWLLSAVILLCGPLFAAAPPDEAKAAGKHAEDFMPKVKYDYWPAMDTMSEAEAGGRLWPDALMDKASSSEGRKRNVHAPVLSESEFFGRNTWMIWCGGNERFWDWLANNSYGFMDLLKLVDSRNRNSRWKEAGMVNEPGMKQAGKPDADGLWLDAQDGSGSYTPSEDIYGRSSGVIGLRLFRNPEFEKNKAEWDAEKFYNDSDYYSNPRLVRPWRVGMSCAFCHASAHPLRPPLDPANPKWDNISGSIGSQYLRIRSVFGGLLPKNSFVYHLLDSQPPGTIDTSLIASDNINNTNTMNAIFAVPQRVARASWNPFERLSGPSRNMPELDPSEPQPYRNPRPVPHILLDGADSIGVWGALARVYLNIGTYSEQWNQLHNPLIGFVPQKPFKLQDCQDQSVYWQATQLRVSALRDYFLKITPSMPLQDADQENPNAANFRQMDVSLLKRGREVFAANCIVCHSSIQPDSDLARLPKDLKLGETFAQDMKLMDDFNAKHREIAERRNAAYKRWAEAGEFWDHEPGQWLDDKQYAAWARDVVEEEWFWRQNYLSTDNRVPVNYVNTNSARAMGTNGMNGHMWEDFAADSFRELPSVGAISFFNPYKMNKAGQWGDTDSYTPRHKGRPEADRKSPEWNGGGGPGFYRPPSLISVWATAPYLHNNSLGLFNNDPSVKGRIEAFQDGIRKLLWPEMRLEHPDDAMAAQLKKDHGLIWRTTEETYITIPGRQLGNLTGRLPALLSGMLSDPPRWLSAFSEHPWLPSAFLIALAAALLWWTGKNPVHARRLRWVGYSSILSALLVGLLLYFINGRWGDLKIGPIPKGTPVNLLANMNPEDHEGTQGTIKVLTSALAEIKSKNLGKEETDKIMAERVAPALMEASRCPDFVMDKGHYFPWFDRMSDSDKECLIELLKTF